MEEEKNNSPQKLSRYLSPLGIWALAFGSAVGWGAFVMPGTTFLPIAGPLGTAIGMGIGAVVMLVIGMNYCYLMNHFPDAGGVYTYAKKIFGYDHGYLSAWFLVLVYVAIAWANATAFALICRNLFGHALQFGFHYQVFGYDVYMGEAVFSALIIVLVSVICIYEKRMAGLLQCVMAVVLIGGIVIGVVTMLVKHGGEPGLFTPAYAPGKSAVLSVINIVALAPWAFAGFESVSHSAEEIAFPVKKMMCLIIAALATSMCAYIFLSCLAVSVLPSGFESWPQYIGALDGLEGRVGLPTFFSAGAMLGKAGSVIFGLAVVAAVTTGLVGNFIAASRLFYSMAKDGILPEWFGRLNKDGSPKNAFLFLMGISVFIPFLGRTAIDWIVDVNTIGATIAYAYTSAAAMVVAKKEGKSTGQITGIIGLVMAVVFFLYTMLPNFWSISAMATESYLILAAWCIFGFVFFRYVFRKDHNRRFGKSTVVWIALLFLIFFTSLMWVRQATHGTTEKVVNDIRTYYEEHYEEADDSFKMSTEQYLTGEMQKVNDALTCNSIIQMGLIVAGLGIMFSVYTTMSHREKKMEIEKAQAEQSNLAKSTFLSNMSHDIRTPMNAIVGYTGLAKKEADIPQNIAEYLDKIDVSSHHLLALINDVLEMSRIESGKMELELTPVNLVDTLQEVYDMFVTQMESKNIIYTVNTKHVEDAWVLCDKHSLNRVLLNLVSNALKFTPEGGQVAVVLKQKDGGPDGKNCYELRVRDSGIGMSEEFAKKVFEAFEREKSSTVSKIQGTGLGMSIAKNIIELMGGTIDVHTEQGKGTEFVICLVLSPASEIEPAEAGQEVAAPSELDFGKMKMLLVEDNEINREIAEMILEEAGVTLDTAEDGQIAVERIAHARPGEFDVVLMDIQMPVMDGYEATKAIRALKDKELANIPIIAMTANAFAEDVQAAKDAGMDGHVAKPLDIAKMMDTLAEILQNRKNNNGNMK